LLALSMTDDDWTIRQKPYDLRQRLFQFACIIVRVVQFLHKRGPVAAALSYQLLKSGTSAGANYEEADTGPAQEMRWPRKGSSFESSRSHGFGSRSFANAGF
jgi:hypothetical protein